MSKITAKDGDIAVVVTDLVTTTIGAAIAGYTSGTVNFTLGVSDSFANLVSSTEVSANMQSIDAKDSDINITINDTSVSLSSDDNVTGLNALMSATTGNVIATVMSLF